MAVTAAAGWPLIDTLIASVMCPPNMKSGLIGGAGRRERAAKPFGHFHRRQKVFRAANYNTGRHLDRREFLADDTVPAKLGMRQ
jgi:hypothetical protein